MATSQPQQADAPTRPGLLETLARNKRVVAIVLSLVASAFGALAIGRSVWLELLPKATWADILDPIELWALASCSVLALVSGGCVSAKMGQKLGEVERMRLMLLIAGASFGILTTVLGMALPFTPVYSAVFAGGPEEWRKGTRYIYTVALALLGGLGLAFASLQLARGVERENALMRRLLYGFSTVFTTLLLISVLLLVNLLPYVPSVFNPFYGFMNATFDWTKSRLYSLSDRSRATLTSLKEPVKAYVFLDSNDAIGDETITLLQNCRGVTQQISWETISSLDRKRIQELFKEYQEKIVQDQPDEFGRAVLRDGVLLVYGEKPKEKAVFVPRESLFREQPSPEGAGSRQIFTGEAVLLKAIRSLTEGKLTVYFTQGEGELELSAPRKPNGLDLIQQGMRQLETYDLKPLTFEPGSAEVPKDADVVVVAQARQMKPEALRALGAYMGYEYHEADGSFSEAPGGRKGRLFVLEGVALANKKIVHTGLEPLLAKMGVQVGDDRVLSLASPGDATAIEVQTSPNSANPVAKAYGPPNEMIFQFDGVRSVSPAPGGGPFAVDELLVTADPRVWIDTNLEASPDDLATQRAKDPGARFSPTPVSLGVAVSERGAVPNDPFHAGVAAEGGPRLVVVGASSWIANGGQINQNGLIANYSLCSSCISWLRGEPDIGAAPEDVDENKVRPRVQLNLSAGGYATLVLLPWAHMALVVIAAAAGVWLVRRR